MKYYIKTYGCQMNYSDSERIAGVLEAAGYEKASSESKADLVALNVCSVRKSAVDRIAGNFKKYKKYKAKNPNFKTVITGCVLESDRGRFEKLFDLVIDIKEIGKLSRWLHSPEGLWSRNAERNQSATQMQKGSTASRRGLWSQHINDKQTHNNSDYFQIAPKHQSKITAFVPIMTGCDNFCSYCVVPYTRGREKSRPAEEIISEVSGLVNEGYKEIILLGQNVNSYTSIKYQVLSIKQDTKLEISGNSAIEQYNNTTINFPKLLKLINAIPGEFWIRFLTSHPKDMTEELIETVAECEKCVEYIHLALQSGDDEILKKMNRKYTAEHYLKLIRKIRASFASIRSGFERYPAISTDIIVGFPGETEEQFQNTVKVMEEAKFDMAYLNKYSPRAGTASAKLVDDVSWEEKKNRENILNKVLKKTALENNQKYVGEIVEVLVEKIDDNFMYGKTRSFKNVKIIAGSIVPECSGLWSRNAECNKSQSINAKRLHSPEAGTMEPANLIGKFAKIKITQAGAWGLEGKMV